ncbi:DUF1835 domain-containing protein [Roseivirga sp. BDSF3-8]|uniref:DUF1835 domain-containing protein n=1 Tax=Roseivirga sp. BDSF3-8 TaxID=3241598 RepID=UPI003531CF6E
MGTNSLAPQHHILNGDALKDHFPDELTGEVIVLREALVEGSVSGKYPDGFFTTRALHISDNYPDTTAGGYRHKSALEIQKIGTIPAGSEVNLWFEDDLFCQVNFWFSVWLLQHYGKSNPLFLIRPGEQSPYSFAALDQKTLMNAFHQRKPIQSPGEIAALWELYKAGKPKELHAQAANLQSQYPFILSAVEAHLDRFPVKGGPGRPERSLLRIMDELQTREFGPVFREFTRREAIYGFGDLQVKALYDKLLASS